MRKRILKFFLSVAMASRDLHGNQFIGQYNKESPDNATYQIILALVLLVWDKNIFKGFTIYFY